MLNAPTRVLVLVCMQVGSLQGGADGGRQSLRRPGFSPTPGSGNSGNSGSRLLLRTSSNSHSAINNNNSNNISSSSGTSLAVDPEIETLLLNSLQLQLSHAGVSGHAALAAFSARDWLRAALQGHGAAATRSLLLDLLAAYMPPEQLGVVRRLVECLDEAGALLSCFAPGGVMAGGGSGGAAGGGGAGGGGAGVGAGAGALGAAGAMDAPRPGIGAGAGAGGGVGVGVGAGGAAPGLAGQQQQLLPSGAAGTLGTGM